MNVGELKALLAVVDDDRQVYCNNAEGPWAIESVCIGLDGYLVIDSYAPILGPLPQLEGRDLALFQSAVEQMVPFLQAELHKPSLLLEWLKRA